MRRLICYMGCLWQVYLRRAASPSPTPASRATCTRRWVPATNLSRRPQLEPVCRGARPRGSLPAAGAAARGQAGMGDGAPERSRRHDRRPLGVPDAGAVVVVPEIPGTAETGAETAGPGAHRAAAAATGAMRHERTNRTPPPGAGARRPPPVRPPCCRTARWSATPKTASSCCRNRAIPRDAALGCVWKVQPRNVGATSDAAVEQMGVVLQGLFRSLAPGTTIQVLMHMAPTDRVDAWSEFRKDAPDLYSLNEFQEASLKEGLVHADGAKRWRLRETTTLMTARLSAPIPDLRRRQRAFSLLRSQHTLLREMNRLTETVLAQVVEELEDLRVLCESVLDLARVGAPRDSTAPASTARYPGSCSPGSDRRGATTRSCPCATRLLSVPARTTGHGSWVFGPDETDPRGWRAGMGSARHVAAAGADPHLSGHAFLPARPAGRRALRPLGGAARHAPHPGHPGRRSRPGRRARHAQAEAKLRQHPEEHPVRRRRPGEGETLRQDLDKIMRDTTSHILHTRVHLVLWGKNRPAPWPPTFAVVTQSGRRLGLEFMPEDHHRAPALPAVPAPGPSTSSTRKTRCSRALAGASRPFGGAPAAAVRRLHRLGHAGAALHQRARRSGHLRLLRPPPAAHHRGRHVALRQVLPGQSPDPAGAAASAPPSSSSTAGPPTTPPARSTRASTWPSTWTGRCVSTPLRGDLGRQHKTFLVALIDQMASGVSGKDSAGFGPGREVGVQPGASGLCGMARRKPPGRGAAAWGLLQPAQASAVRR